MIKRQMTATKKLIYILLVLFLLAIISTSVLAIFRGFDRLHITGNAVEVIYVQGVMITGELPGVFGVVTSEEIVRELRSASDNPSVKAVVFRINSPGGSPAAAEEIIAEMKKIKKPIVVSMGDVAASAAYYMSAPADRIIANPDTITGSIGVIWPFQNSSEKNKKDGIEFYISKSGKFKDMGADWRGLSDEEKEYADQVIRESYMRFVEEVAKGRNLSIGEVKYLADGRVYTGAKAREVGLVDDMGSLEDAIDTAAKLGNIEGKPGVIYANKPSIAGFLFGNENSRMQNSPVDTYLYYNPYWKLLAIYQ